MRLHSKMWGILLLTLSVAGLQAAAEQFSFTVSPLLVELQGLPGATLPFEIAIAHEGDGEAAHFTVSVVPIRQDSTGNYKLDPNSKSPHSAAGWIKVTPASFTLAPGTGQLIRGELAFPRNFRGGAYAAVVLELKPQEEIEEGPSQVFRNQLAVIVEAVAATPGVRPDLHIGSFSVLSAAQKELEEYARLYGPHALIFTGEVGNEGNVHAFATGTISLWDEGGRKINEIPLGSGRGAVLPEATVRMGSVLTNGLPPGSYRLQAVVNYGGLRPAITRQTFTVGGKLEQAAQGGRSVRLALEPESVTFDLVPGARRFAALRLRNLDRAPITVTGHVLPLVYDAAGNPNLEAVRSDHSSAGWVSLRPESVTIPPGTTRNLQVGIQAPRDAAAGGRYAQVVLVAGPSDPQGGAAGETEVSVPIHGLIGKGLAAVGELSPLSIQESDDGRFLTIGAIFTNRGNLHVTPSADVLLELKTIPQTAPGTEYVGDPIWVEVTRLSVPPSHTPVLPGGARNLGALIDKPKTPGEYRVRVTVRYAGGAPLVQQKNLIVGQSGAAPK